MDTDPLPSVVAQGSPRDVGRAHGQAFADLVHASVASCHRRIDEVLKLPIAEAQRFAKRQGDLLGELDVRLVDEMHGIAEGADVVPLDIVLLHVRTALSRMVESERAVARMECTTIAVAPQLTSSTVFDLTTRRMWNAPGPPCTGTPTAFRLDDPPLPS